MQLLTKQQRPLAAMHRHPPLALLFTWCRSQQAGRTAHPLLMKHLSRCPLSRGSYTSTTSTNFSSMCPSSASPAQQASCLVALTNWTLPCAALPDQLHMITYSFHHRVPAPVRHRLDGAGPIAGALAVSHDVFWQPACPIIGSESDHEEEMLETAKLLLRRDCAAFQDADLARALPQALLSLQWC